MEKGADSVTPIESIRSEVEEIRKEHFHYSGEDTEEGPLCGHERCGFTWPCPILRLAQEKLKLAEWIYSLCGNVHVLSEVAR